MLAELSLPVRWVPESPTELIGRVLLTLAIIFAFYVVYQQKFAPLSGIKGPFGASLSRLWLVYHALRADLFKYTPLLHRKYGEHRKLLP